MYLSRAIQVRPATSFSFFNFCSVASSRKDEGRNILSQRRNFVTTKTFSNSKMSDSIIASVCQSDDTILEDVLDLVRREKLLCDAVADNGSQKVVEFVHPKELEKCLGGLEIGTEPSSRDEVKEFMETVVRYSVKTCHHRFYNQVQYDYLMKSHSPNF